jgi:hypothetical protein
MDALLFGLAVGVSNEVYNRVNSESVTTALHSAELQLTAEFRLTKP